MIFESNLSIKEDGFAGLVMASGGVGGETRVQGEGIMLLS